MPPDNKPAQWINRHKNRPIHEMATLECKEIEVKLKCDYMGLETVLKNGWEGFSKNQTKI